MKGQPVLCVCAILLMSFGQKFGVLCQIGPCLTVKLHRYGYTVSRIVEPRLALPRQNSRLEAYQAKYISLLGENLMVYVF